jgi:YidC/Oxa1 family membrane protein insertase
MENRAILAAVLMAALLILYQVLFAPAPTPPRQGQPSGEAPKPGPSQAEPVAPTPTPPQALPPARILPRLPEQRVTVDTPIYRAVVGSNGGRLLEWTLHYRGEKVLADEGRLGLRGLIIERSGAGREPVRFTVTGGPIVLDQKDGEKTLVMTGEDPYGVRVREAATFRADQYVVDLAVRLENSSPRAQSFGVLIPWLAPIKPGPGGVQWPVELVWQVDGSVHRDEPLDKVPAIGPAQGDWAGLDSRYYLTALIPKSPGLSLMLGKVADNQVETGVRGEVTLKAGETWQARAQLYAGPKEYRQLRAHGLEGAIDFGGFPLPRRYGGLPMDWLGVPVLLVMNFFYRYIGNYGISIILLTVLTKVLFYPLTVKSMGSMKKMQMIQPQANALRAKYKNDPQRAQRETLELYRREGVNPLGGCLPMVIQIPIFYALYIALSVAVELQNAGFLCFGRAPVWVPFVGGADLWICDLAVQDPLYILPILMGITMFVQQKMQPTMGDPNQAKMMLIMPFVFTFMFLKLPSGLVLYWTVSNALQIFQQRLMNRTPARVTGRGAKDPARA